MSNYDIFFDDVVAGYHTLGTAVHYSGSALTYLLSITDDPDDPPRQADPSLFTTPIFPGLILKIVSGRDELSRFPAVAILPRSPSNAVQYLVAEKSIPDVLYKAASKIYTMSSIANYTWGWKGGVDSVTPSPLAGSTGYCDCQVPEGDMYAVVSDLEYGSLQYSTPVSSASASGAARRYAGWIGKTMPFTTVRNAMLLHRPAMLADAPNEKVRTCMARAFADEYNSVPEDATLKTILGLTAHTPNVVDAATLEYNFGLLYQDKSSLMLNETRPLHVTHMNSLANPCLASCANVAPSMRDEFVSRILMSTAIVRGTDFQTTKGVAEHYPASAELTHEQIISLYDDLIKAPFTPEAVEALTMTSSRSVSYLDGEGAAIEVGSTGDIELYAGKDRLGWISEPIYGQAASTIHNHMRRVYARAEDYAKILYS